MRGAVRPRSTRRDGERTAWLTLFRRGFLAMAPLWAGAIPVGVAYAVAAHDAGLGAGATQLMSLLVFSAAAQVSAVSLLRAGASLPLLIATAMALNVQLLLIGLAVGRQARPSWRQRLLTASVLTDGAYGVSAALGPLRLPLLLGAGSSMYLAWNGGTFLGLLVGAALPDPERLGLGFIVPLAFLAVLVPLVRTRTSGLVVLSAAAATLLLAPHVPTGVAVLGAGLAGSAAGGWWSRRGEDAA